MVQLYFLSILCNALSGYVLFAGNDNESSKKPLSFTDNPTFSLVLGILSAVTGVLKLLSPTVDRIPIIGDLVPAISGVAAGLVLIFGIYRQSTPSSSTSTNSLDSLAGTILTFRKPFGLGLLAVALLHFLFPEALFL
ncbi:MAG: hypothetical protein FWF68_05280 [Spirochaetes bacterium]|nr:hypothetical protein [Spirochaetota bacterium]